MVNLFYWLKVLLIDNSQITSDKDNLDLWGKIFCTVNWFPTHTFAKHLLLTINDIYRQFPKNSSDKDNLDLCGKNFCTEFVHKFAKHFLLTKNINYQNSLDKHNLVLCKDTLFVH